MTTEQAPASRCIKAGAGYACAWFLVLAFLLWNDILPSFDPEKILGMTLLIGSLGLVAVGIPAWSDARFRNAASISFLVIGAVLACALLATVAFVIVLQLFSGSGLSGHN